MPAVNTKLISVNVGLPREVKWKSKMVTTGIFKDPVEGRVNVQTLNVEGDKQADLEVHGGPSKAVYAYPSEHYAAWRDELDDMEMPWGIFGENLTVEGLLEDQVRIGDRLSIGTATFQVTEPRTPCYKLAVRFDRPDVVRLMNQNGRTGFYLRVLEEGFVEAGDDIDVLGRDPGEVTVANVSSLHKGPDKDNAELMRQAISVAALGESWREYFRHQLKKVEAAN
jgi:MOSC domain-containing protein YiiM